MNFRKAIILTLLILPAFTARSQQTTVYTEATLAYKRGVEFFNQHLYAMAQQEFRAAAEYARPVNEPDWKTLKTESELYYAKCAVRLGQPEAEKLALDFLRENSPSPIASQAALEIGNYYFDRKEYEEALKYFDLATSASGQILEEITFKKGYSHFVTKAFTEAKKNFSLLRENTEGAWYFPANYYYGCCMFFEAKYAEAVKAFKICEKSEQYKSAVPYYLLQIYAAQKEYDKVIDYGKSKASDNSLRNRAEINQLVGQAYYEKGKFEAAQPYLEFASKNGLTLRSADYYQLGFTQYMNGDYQEAADNFVKVTEDSLQIQNSQYHLGDSYLHLKKKTSARVAFGKAARMNANKEIREDALINYAKLSHELNDDKEAIRALQRIDASSDRYEDAQELMGIVLLSTRDYEQAIEILENIKKRTPKLNETYQKVTYLRGLQLCQDNQSPKARRYFEKSLDFPLDKKTAALCNFWMGSILNETKAYEESKTFISKFLGSAKGFAADLPDESSIGTGNYVQGYNNLLTGDYDKAANNFNEAVNALKKYKNPGDQLKSVLNDAVLRSADCLFATGKPQEALRLYKETISKKSGGADYAMFQIALIQGLNKDITGKIGTLQDLIDGYPSSIYMDDAWYELGNTFMGAGNQGKAREAYTELANGSKKSDYQVRALLQLGLISENKGDNKTAEEYYLRALKSNPTPQEKEIAFDALLAIYTNDNEMDKYVKLKSQYSDGSDSGDPAEGYYSIAETQFRNSKFDKAIEGFNRYIREKPKGPNVSNAYFLRGESYFELKKYPEALKDYEVVLSKDDTRNYARAAEKAAGICAEFETDFEKALEYAQKWEEASKTEKSRLAAQKVALRAAYETKKAAVVSDYARKINASPVSTESEQAEANYYGGKMAFDKGEYNRALPQFKSVTEADVAIDILAEAYHLICQILFKQKKYQEVIEMVDEANSASGNSNDWIARNIILRSDTHIMLEEKADAIADLESILEYYDGNDPEIRRVAQEKLDKLQGKSNRPTNKTDNKNKNRLELDEGN
jgi:tetratricopeptide (TPR) repeat protein